MTHRPALIAASLVLALAAVATFAERPNVVLIVIDDQRYDAFSFAGHPFLETPNLDALAKNSVVFDNAFVTTSLCSPSRASILTGQYAHKHQVLANRVPLDPQLPTFAKTMQAAGYDTGFVGKWHMGDPNDEPRAGWRRWVSFPGQGAYTNQNLNIDGTHVEGDGYTTDVLTEHAVDFIAEERSAPFLLYLSHKAAHSPFTSAARHRNSYGDADYPHPPSMTDTEENYAGKPAWVRAQRKSWHGVDGMYAGSMDFDKFARDYAETLRAVDDSVGQVVAALRASGQLGNTVIVYTSDNGFQFGEHGLIDKRTMYEESIRVPMIVHAPGLSKAARLPHMILNIDIAPTLIELAEATIPSVVQGKSFLQLLKSESRASVEWRNSFLYEYFWERAFPQTPTVLGVRTDRYKLMRYHGIWDRYELYDLDTDPNEMNNLIGEYQTTDQIGHVERRVLGGRTRLEKLYLGTGTEDEELRQIFTSLWTQLDAHLKETAAAAEPNWRP